MKVFLGGLAAVAVILALVFGGPWYVHRKMRVAGYAEDSICGRRMMHGYNQYLAFLSAPLPASGPDADSRNQEATQKFQDNLIQSSNQARDEFAEVLKVAASAKRMQLITANILCFPDDVLVRQIILFDEYARDLAARLKADPAACKANAEQDAVAFLTRRFPCPAPAGAAAPAPAR